MGAIARLAKRLSHRRSVIHSIFPIVFLWNPRHGERRPIPRSFDGTMSIGCLHRRAAAIGILWIFLIGHWSCIRVLRKTTLVRMWGRTTNTGLLTRWEPRSLRPREPPKYK